MLWVVLAPYQLSFMFLEEKCCYWFEYTSAINTKKTYFFSVILVLCLQINICVRRERVFEKKHVIHVLGSNFLTQMSLAFSFLNFLIAIFYFWFS